jgi:hypothetical protein
MMEALVIMLFSVVAIGPAVRLLDRSHYTFLGVQASITPLWDFAVPAEDYVSFCRIE